jgi:hypothetical protein
VTTGVLFAASLILAQDAAQQQTAPPPAVEQAVRPPADAPTRVDPQHRRDQIGVMEGVLAKAVANGAVRAGRDLVPNMPGTLSLTGQARARGFILEGYGVFFDVEIPSLLKSFVWSMQNMERDLQTANSALQAMRDLVDNLPDAKARQQYQQAVRQLEQQVGPIPQKTGNTASAASTAGDTVILPGSDPDALYAKSVIASCVDVMLDYSKPLDVQPEEWFTVALRGAEQAAPGELHEPRTVLLRVRGSDLAEFLAGRTSREEVRRKVIIREF